MWCQLCDDKIIGTTVKIQGKTYEVCNHCASLTIQSDSNGNSIKD
ncbi:hypothetical protein [Bacillus toyonensis]|nr:hypothetical protein [Bacillus toyonensis]EJV41759.1 hypothetical protein IEA_05644 [Bacillus toyonensis]